MLDLKELVKQVNDGTLAWEELFQYLFENGWYWSDIKYGLDCESTEDIVMVGNSKVWSQQLD